MLSKDAASNFVHICWEYCTRSQAVQELLLPCRRYPCLQRIFDTPYIAYVKEHRSQMTAGRAAIS
jgi:hypothetical protein